MSTTTSFLESSEVKDHLERTLKVALPLDMTRVAAIILGGGEGKRLFPLTSSRCKPAIGFGGRYRLIDIPISNALNSGLSKIFVLTQFLSSSLHRHIFKTYPRDLFFSGGVELLPAEQKPKDEGGWYQGTADAVRQCLDYIVETPADYFLILSGDQLYHLNFQEMVRFGRMTEADLVVASLPVDASDAERMGVLKVDSHLNIVDFVEKPKYPLVLDSLTLSPAQHAQFKVPSKEKKVLASMGIYLFKREALFKLLQEDFGHDFGRDIIPEKVKQGSACAYIHQGYWEDIGTIASFYNANIAMTHARPPFDCYDERNPLFTTPLNLPGPKVMQASITDSILCEGAVVDGAVVKRSILGQRSVIRKNCTIENSYLMGNDFYKPPIKTTRLPEKLEVEEGCTILNAILDKNVHLGKGVKLVNQKQLTHYDGEGVYIRDGIIIVARGTSLPAGYVL